MNDLPPHTTETIVYRAKILREDPKKKSWAKRMAYAGFGTLLFGASVLGYNAYQNRPYDASQCKTTELTSLLWQGGADAERATTIRNVEQYLTTHRNSDEQELGNVALRLLRANAADAGIDESTLSTNVKNSSVYRYLSFINDMRGDRFADALTTITGALDNRALDCAETGAWDTNNRRATIARWAMNNGELDKGYAVANHVLTQNASAQFNLNLIAGEIKLFQPTAEPQTALSHFAAARGFAQNPSDITRTEYFLGMSNTALQNNAEARVHFLNASSADPQSLYGQISAFKIGQPVAVTTPTANTTNPNDPPLAIAATIDACPNQLLIDQRADIAAVPASLTKMMAMYTFAQIMSDPNTDLNLDTMLTVPSIIRDKIPSDLATFENLTVGRQLPARMFLTMAGARSDAISTITLAMAGANARGWQGTPEQLNDRFVALMNENARRLGMNESNFGNVIGNNAARGDAGNISSPHDMTQLITAFQRDFPGAFDIALGQHRINIRPISDAVNPSSRSLRDDMNVMGAKTGFLRDRDPTYNIAAGYNEALRLRFRDMSGARYTGSIAVFGADSADNREDIMKSVIPHFRSIDVRAFCEAGSNFRYHPFAVPAYSKRLAAPAQPR